MTGALLELRTAIADHLERLPDTYTWTSSVRYDETDGSELGWGFDIDRPNARPLCLWFDAATQELQLQVPETFLRRRGLSVTWTDLSDPEAVRHTVLAYLREQLPQQ